MAAVAVLALAAACDSGSETDFDPVTAGTTGAGAAPVAGGRSGAGANQGGQLGGGGQANAGATSNGGMPTGGIGTAGTASGTGGAGATGSCGTGGGPGTAGSGASAGSGGTAGASGSPGNAGEGGRPSGEAGADAGGMGGDANEASGGETGEGGGETGQGGNGDGAGCDAAGLHWAPRPSNVMLLVDRSGTMFDVNGQPWASVRDALLPVVDAYDKLENIGFLSVAGEVATCPLLDEVAPAAGNYTTIAAMYNALAKPLKGESPFMLALSRARVLLEAAAAPATEKFVIMVIDGQPDYCGDGNDKCPIDSVVARIQSLKASGVTTLIGALPIYSGADTALYGAALQAYANAGAGLPTASVGDTPANIYFQCTSTTGWNEEFAASGKPVQQALGTYAAVSGAAAFTSLTPDDALSLATSLSQLFARAQSCTFTATGGKVPLASAQTGTVKVAGAAVPYDATNGWQMKSETELELVGAACEALRAAPDVMVSFELPCTP